MMSNSLTSEPAITAEDDVRYCKFGIAVDQPKRKGVDTIETDTFNCIAFDENANMMSLFFSKGWLITLVGTLRNNPDNSAVIIVDEIHFSVSIKGTVPAVAGVLFRIWLTECPQTNGNGLSAVYDLL